MGNCKSYPLKYRIGKFDFQIFSILYYSYRVNQPNILFKGAIMANKSLKTIYKLGLKSESSFKRFVPASSNFTKITVLGYKVDKLELGYWDFGKGPAVYIRLYLGGGKIKITCNDVKNDNVVGIYLHKTKIETLVKRLKSKVNYTESSFDESGADYINCTTVLKDEIVKLLSETKGMWE